MFQPLDSKAVNYVFCICYMLCLEPDGQPRKSKLSMFNQMVTGPSFINDTDISAPN